MELRKEVLIKKKIKAFFLKRIARNRGTDPVLSSQIPCVKKEKLNYVWLWILCGLPFSLHRMCLWIVPGGGSWVERIALFA